MSKGTFQNPRSLGTVSEIVPVDARVRLKKEEAGLVYEASAIMAEGSTPDLAPNDIFVPKKEDRFVLDFDTLTAAQKNTVKRFLDLFVTKYVEAKGYSDVTVT